MLLGKILYKLKIFFISTPNIFYKKKLHLKLDIVNINKLHEEGYVKFEKIFSDNKCEKITQIINELIDHKKISYTEKQKIWKIKSVDNFINEIDEILNFQNIEKISSDYFKKENFISDFDVRRVEPATYKQISDMGKSNSDWHKDIRGKQLKLMVYLSDVTEEDNHFSLIPCTHNKIVYNFEQSRLNSKEIDSEKEVKIIGKKGTGILFDTNIIHRLNRYPNSSMRDSLTVNFTPGQNLNKIFFGNKNFIDNKSLLKKLTNNSFLFSRI